MERYGRMARSGDFALEDAMSLTDLLNNNIVVVVLIIGLTTAVINLGFSLYKDRAGRRRDLYSEAYRTIVIYAEFPYIIRRRNAGDAANERIRISTDIREVQERIAFYGAWIATESRHVADKYDHLVKSTRAVAGSLMHESWLRPGCSKDDEMNVSDIDLSDLEHPREQYLQAVRHALLLRYSPLRWWRWLLTPIHVVVRSIRD